MSTKKDTQKKRVADQTEVLKLLGFTVCGNLRGFYNGGSYRFYSSQEKIRRKSNWGSGYYSDHIYHDEVKISTQGSTYSCGVPEIGGLSIPERGHKATIEVLTEILKFVVINENSDYIRLTTTSQKKYDKWNKAAELAGFTKVASLPSKHGRARYKCLVWQWLSPVDDVNPQVIEEKKAA